jgi:hypothetical protein
MKEELNHRVTEDTEKAQRKTEEKSKRTRINADFTDQRG